MGSPRDRHLQSEGSVPVTRSEALERYPTTIASVAAAGAVAAALVGGPAAKVGVGVLAALVMITAARLLRRAWHDRFAAGTTAMLLLVPLTGAAIALRAPGASRPERWGGAVDLVVATSFVAAAILVFAGTRLLALTRRRRAGTPWASLASDDRPDERMRRAGRRLATTGVLMVVASLVLVGVAPRGLAGLGADWAGVVVLSVLAVTALVVAPALAAAAVVGQRDRAERERALQRQTIAAHLHDSVLQTLALVQRRLDDPEEARRLIRHQERELRDWLAGRDALRPDSLGGALRQVVDEVEAELHVAIELEVLGDRPIDARVGHLVDAAREALRNAARHGRGAPIRVLATADGPTTDIYVRDEGPGFALDDVPSERRGIRDAIVGRMTAVGGSAVIDAASGAGTEVVLRLPARIEDAR